MLLVLGSIISPLLLKILGLSLLQGNTCMILIISLLGFGILYKFLPLILRIGIIPAKFPRRLLIQLFMQDIQSNMQHLVHNLEWLSDIKRMSVYLKKNYKLCICIPLFVLMEKKLLVLPHRYDDMLVVPIIENTPEEKDLKERMARAINEYPDSCAVLVRRHGVYVWGETWEKAKTM